MKKRYLYLIFTTLSVVVVILLALIFKLQKTSDTPINTISGVTKESEKLHSLAKAQNYHDSWVGKISKDKNQKEYSYSVQKFHIEFNRDK